MAHDAPLTMQQAADRLGVHYMTVYRYVRLGMLPAHKEGATWRINPRDLERLDTSPDVPARKRQAPWRQRLLTRMLSGDENGSWGVVESAMASGMAPTDFYCDVLAPALHEIGELWAAGTIGIEQEHLASNVAGSIIGRLGPRFNRVGRRRGTVVLAMPEGERHQLGAAMVADNMRLAGYRVLHLGADTPAEALVAALEGVQDLTAVAISVVNSDRRGAAEALALAARAIRPEVPVIIGGAAVPDEVSARQLGADGWAARACDINDLISRLARRDKAGL